MAFYKTVLVSLVLVAVVLAGTEIDNLNFDSSFKPAARPIGNLQALSAFANHHLGPVISKLVTGKVIPDDEEVDGHIHVQLSKMVIKSFKQQSVAIDIDPATKNTRMTESFETTVSANLNICTELFGKCRTILGCAGDVKLDLGGTVTGDAALGADSAGRPTASIAKAGLKFKTFKLDGHIGICDVAKTYLNADRATKIFGKSLPNVVKQLNTEIAAKLAAVPTKFNINSLLGIDWSLSAAPTASGHTVEIPSRAAVFKVKDGSYAPFTAVDMSPSVPTDQKPVGVSLSETIGNSVLWAYYDEGLMELSHSYTFLKQSVKLDIAAAAAPTLSFTKDKKGVFAATAVGTIEVNSHDIAKVTLSIDADATIGFGRTAEGNHPAVYADVAAASVEDLKVSLSVIGDVKAKFAQDAINHAIARFLPDVSAKLKSVLIPLPSLEGFTIGDAELEFADGFLSSVAALTPA